MKKIVLAAAAIAVFATGAFAAGPTLVASEIKTDYVAGAWVTDVPVSSELANLKTSDIGGF